jgi:hypothetical protein
MSSLGVVIALINTISLEDLVLVFEYFFKALASTQVISTFGTDGWHGTSFQSSQNRLWANSTDYVLHTDNMLTCTIDMTRQTDAQE